MGLSWMNQREIYPQPNRSSRDVAAALSPLFPISRFLGILPYSDAFDFSNGWLVYSLSLHFILLGVNIFHKIYLAVTLGFSGYNRYRFLQDFEIILNYVTVITHLIQLTFKKQNLGSILRKTAEIDTFWVIYTKHFARNYFIGGALWLVVPLTLEFNNLEQVVSLTIFFTIVMVLCSFLEVLRCHLKCIVEQLQPDKVHLANLIETHNTIVRLAAAINELFSWQILWICIRCSVTFVIDIFMLLKIVSTTDLKETYIEFIMSTSSSLWDFLVLFLLSSSCSKTSEHINAFNSHLFKIIRSHATLFRSEKLKLYAILREGHEFNACGYFTVGYPLITSVIGATTTYVVILVQFLFDTGGTQDLKDGNFNLTLLQESTSNPLNETTEYEYE
ncbi:hypothetical protein GE061_010450 [Apolygus lucorum]|uniref:Gustatory receptor n=1 Tax=Apolygus lucorum TaxID=248454 RepID=A0A6A4JJH5_APOLU|nr:hypothetical protein GE061_010450 [Apolygus lucorum]